MYKALLLESCFQGVKDKAPQRAYKLVGVKDVSCL